MLFKFKNAIENLKNYKGNQTQKTLKEYNDTDIYIHTIEDNLKNYEGIKIVLKTAKKAKITTSYLII